MKKIIQLVENFEKRNNISIAIHFYSDGSFHVEEFWNDEVLFDGKLDEFIKFITNTQYKLDDEGFCLSPIEILE